jgi:carboxymethylenebutenolidase
VAGFCRGGGETFRFATKNPGIRGAFVFYGTGPRQEEELKKIECPVYGFYAGNDARVTSTVGATAESMKKAAKTYAPITYEGAGHGFMRAGEQPDADSANKKARDEAWARWKDLLKKAS